MKTKQTEESIKVTFIATLVALFFFSICWFASFSNRHFLKSPAKQIEIHNGKEFIQQLKRSKVQGRVLLILATSTYYKIPPLILTTDAETNIKGMEHILDPKQIEVNDENFVYVALLQKLIKKIFLVLPREEWEIRKHDYWSPYLKLKDGAIDGTMDEGTPCTISSESRPVLPKEKPVLLVDEKAFKNWEVIAQKTDPDLLIIFRKNMEETK